jgi:glycosyltransferase involved in cell wall biosynthesis
MEKYSVVIITFNEEKNIKRCLDSIANISDDIIIIDSFSTDKTQEICEQFNNLRFVKHKWEGYSKTKNYGNSLAKYDYIISLDADEVISTELAKSIQEIEELNGAYEFNRMTNYCGSWIKHCGWYPDKKLRIFNRNEIYWEGDFVHETLVVPENISIYFLEGDLLHYSYHSIEDHYKQIENYSDLHAKKMLKAGKKATIFKLFISPAFKFIRTYILQLGFLDGSAGFTISRISAKAVKLKYQKLKSLQ